jgi:hypothetical protein
MGGKAWRTPALRAAWGAGARVYGPSARDDRAGAAGGTGFRPRGTGRGAAALATAAEERAAEGRPLAGPAR